MKGRIQNIVKQFKEKQASQKKVAPKVAPAKTSASHPKFKFWLPPLGNPKRAEAKPPRESKKRAPRSTALLLGLLGIAVVLGAVFLLPRMVGREEPAPFAPSPSPPSPLSAPPPPTVPALPTAPTRSGSGVDPTPPEVSNKPTPPGASNDLSEERKTSVPVPAAKKSKNPFGDPENRSSGSSAPESLSASSTPPTSLPPPPAVPKELPPLPPPPAGTLREGASATPPPPPEVACLAVFLGKEASAVVRAKGFEGVVSVGETIPGSGKLIEVGPDGCLFSVGERKLAVSLEGEKRWK